MRMFVAILVIVAQLLGPWVCCCYATGHATPLRADTSTPVPPKPKTTCCPHCLPELPTTPAPAKVPAPCPCWGAQLIAVPADKPDLPSVADGLLVQVATEPPAAWVQLPFDAPAVVGLRELPWLTTADLLFTHHVLRC